MAQFGILKVFYLLHLSQFYGIKYYRLPKKDTKYFPPTNLNYVLTFNQFFSYESWRNCTKHVSCLILPSF